MTIPGNEIATRYYNNFQADTIKCRERECVSCPNKCEDYGEFEDDYSYNCEHECSGCTYNCSVRVDK